jgi:hypothetical protein
MLGSSDHVVRRVVKDSIEGINYNKDKGNGNGKDIALFH